MELVLKVMELVTALHRGVVILVLYIVNPVPSLQIMWFVLMAVDFQCVSVCLVTMVTTVSKVW